MGIKFKKPSGMIIQVSDNKETIDYCESLGWERFKSPVKKAVKKAVKKKAK